MIPDYKNTDEIRLWQHEKFLSEIRRLSKQHDWVLVYMHWGNEFIDVPSNQQIHAGRELIDAGASAVVGCHSHVLQPVEAYRDGLIAYSLGNFLFDSYLKMTFPTIIFQLQLQTNPKKIVCQICPLSAQKDYSLCKASREIERRIRKQVSQSVVPVPEDVYLSLIHI